MWLHIESLSPGRLRNIFLLLSVSLLGNKRKNLIWLSCFSPQTSAIRLVNKTAQPRKTFDFSSTLNIAYAELKKMTRVHGIKVPHIRCICRQSNRVRSGYGSFIWPVKIQHDSRGRFSAEDRSALGKGCRVRNRCPEHLVQVESRPHPKHSRSLIPDVGLSLWMWLGL